MELLGTILFFNAFGSIISLLGGLLLLAKKGWAKKYAHYLAAFAAGSLLGTVFFDLFPEALHEIEELGYDYALIFIYALAAILFFFLLERFLHWFHHHGYDEHSLSGKPVVPLLIVGDTIHNFIDGMAIAATFLVSIPAGIITTIAVGAHEIPQEIGDFGIMLKHGFRTTKILLINLISASASFVGVFVAYYFSTLIEGLSVIFISIAAGLFLYIALSDLIPEIHHENKKGLAIWETVWLFAGVLTIYFALFIMHEVFQIGH